MPSSAIESGSGVATVTVMESPVGPDPQVQTYSPGVKPRLANVALSQVEVSESDAPET